MSPGTSLRNKSPDLPEFVRIVAICLVFKIMSRNTQLFELLFELFEFLTHYTLTHYTTL